MKISRRQFVKAMAAMSAASMLAACGGNSGSGISSDGGVYVRGIHTTGSSSQNCGTRLTSTVYNTLQSWISTYP